MSKVILALVVLSAVVMVGCSSKADVGDAEVKVKPGTATAPNLGGPSGGAPKGPAGSPASAPPQTPN